MENEHYICGFAKTTHIQILKSILCMANSHLQVLVALSKKQLQHLNLMKLAKTTKHAIKQ